MKRWLSNGYAQGGVGVLTKHTPAIDLDIYDETINEKLIEWCIENIGQSVIRVGQAPKRLLVYRTDEPFTKITSNKYEDFLGLEHKIEILGDGQQFVAFAVHPDTNEPYEWTTELSIADIPRDDLPPITKEQAEALIDFFESIIPDDWQKVEAGSKAQVIDDSLTEEERVFLNFKPKLDPK